MVKHFLVQWNSISAYLFHSETNKIHDMPRGGQAGRARPIPGQTGCGPTEGVVEELEKTGEKNA